MVRVNVEENLIYKGVEPIPEKELRTMRVLAFDKLLEHAEVFPGSIVIEDDTMLYDLCGKAQRGFIMKKITCIRTALEIMTKTK